MNQDEVQPTVDLYVKATESDWRTVQAPAQQPASAPPADAASAATETKQLMNVARSILMNENGTVE